MGKQGCTLDNSRRDSMERLFVRAMNNPTGIPEDHLSHMRDHAVNECKFCMRKLKRFLKKVRKDHLLMAKQKNPKIRR